MSSKNGLAVGEGGLGGRGDPEYINIKTEPDYRQKGMLYFDRKRPTCVSIPNKKSKKETKLTLGLGNHSKRLFGVARAL